MDHTDNDPAELVCNKTAKETVRESLVMSSNNEEDNNQQHRLLFGWMHIRPRRLQGLLSPKWALFWLSWAGAVQGMCRNESFFNHFIVVQ